LHKRDAGEKLMPHRARGRALSAIILLVEP
jgi:hypothetical protein